MQNTCNSSKGFGQLGLGKKLAMWTNGTTFVQQSVLIWAEVHFIRGLHVLKDFQAFFFEEINNSFLSFCIGRTSLSPATFIFV